MCLTSNSCYAKRTSIHAFHAASGTASVKCGGLHISLGVSDFMGNCFGFKSVQLGPVQLCNFVATKLA